MTRDLADVIQPLDPPHEQIVRLALEGARRIKEQGCPRDQIVRVIQPFMVACLTRLGLGGYELQLRMREIDYEFGIRLSHLYVQKPPVIKQARPASYVSYATTASTSATGTLF